MSMSTCVIGIKPADKRFREMYAIWKACNEANIAPPDAVNDYFNGEPPDERGVTVTIGVGSKTDAVGVTEYRDENQEGFEVDLTQLNKDFKIIRFVNSY